MPKHWWGEGRELPRGVRDTKGQIIMTDRQSVAQSASSRDQFSANSAMSETQTSVRWNRIVEWTDEDMERWRDAHKLPDRPQF
jgi:hypothetical protein